MTTPNDRSRRDDDVHRPNPEHAATDSNAAAKQDQVKADHAALEESARRVEASVPSDGEAATDPRAAAIQDQVRADRDELRESARRVEQSAPVDRTDRR
jgi:hypothetical protein